MGFAIFRVDISAALDLANQRDAVATIANERINRRNFTTAAATTGAGAVMTAQMAEIVDGIKIPLCRRVEGVTAVGIALADACLTHQRLVLRGFVFLAPV